MLNVIFSLISILIQLPMAYFYTHWILNVYPPKDESITSRVSTVILYSTVISIHFSILISFVGLVCGISSQRAILLKLRFNVKYLLIPLLFALTNGVLMCILFTLPMISMLGMIPKKYISIWSFLAFYCNIGIITISYTSALFIFAPLYFIIKYVRQVQPLINDDELLFNV